MKPIVKKVLESGIVDKHTAVLMEKWGYLKDGDSDLVPAEDVLTKATKSQLELLAEEIGDEVDKQRTLRETQLDLEQIRWPVTVALFKNEDSLMPFKTITGVIDRMGRYYFRVQEVKSEWFVPGRFLCRYATDGRVEREQKETILETTTLFIDEAPVCVQVSVDIAV